MRRATACRATDPRDARQANDTRFDQSIGIATRHEKERYDEPVSMLVALTQAEEAAGQPSAFGRAALGRDHRLRANTIFQPSHNHHTTITYNHQPITYAHDTSTHAHVPTTAHIPIVVSIDRIKR